MLVGRTEGWDTARGMGASGLLNVYNSFLGSLMFLAISAEHS